MLYFQPEREPSAEYGIYSPREKNTTVEAFMLFFLLLSWVSFFFVVGSHPGFLAEGVRPPMSDSGGDENDETAVFLVDEEKKEKIGRGESTGIEKIPGLPVVQDPPGPVDAVVAEAYSPSRQCHTCYATQIPRSKHCRHCDRCVATFDHHCSFLHTCIGERNRARFFLFLFLQV